MFTPEQTKLLAEKLEPKNVKGRQQGNAKVQYIEGWHAIAEANRIFGFDGWTRETVCLREACRYEVQIGDKKLPGWKVGYEAKVRVIAGSTAREGTGHGSGIARDLFDAIESAAKESETDAMKRALMTFGNPFGLALYDKSRVNVGYNEREPEPAAGDEPAPTPETAGTPFDEPRPDDPKEVKPVGAHRPPYLDELDRIKEAASRARTSEQYYGLVQRDSFIAAYDALPSMGKAQANTILAITRARLGIKGDGSQRMAG